MDKSQIRQGRVFVRSKKLHNIKSFSCSGKQLPVSECLQSFADYQGNKWGVNNFQMLENIKCFLGERKGAVPRITPAHITRIWSKLANKSRICRDGLSLKAFEFVFAAYPRVFAALLSLWMSSDEVMQSQRE